MGTWIERAPMPTPRHDLQSIAVDGTIYAISGADDLTVDAVEIYDVASDTWTQGPPIPTKRGWLGAARIGRRIYVAGGKTIRHGRREESLRPRPIISLPATTWKCSTWTSRLGRCWHPCPADRAPAWPSPPVRTRYGPSAATPCSAKTRASSTASEVYDVASDTWDTGPALPRPTQGPTVATHDGRIYLTGGISDEDPQRPCRSETYVLDPAVGRWEALAPVPTGRESSGSCVLGDLLYTFGGKDPHYSAATEIYDIEADRWFRDAPMPVGKAWLAACVVGERPFVMGGAHNWEDREGYNWIADLHEFSP